MFEPSDTVVLTYSERIGGGSSSVEVEDQSTLAGAVVEAIRRLPSEESEMARLADLTPGPNIRLSETAAYANTYLGNVERAAAILHAAKATADDREWVAGIRERLQGFERLLCDHGQARAVEYLDAQAADTAKALKLIDV
jgi:thioredoxin-like negative regulator of GroEL